MREIIVRVRALRTCAHSGPRTHMPAQSGLWVRVAVGIVFIEEKEAPSTAIRCVANRSSFIVC